MQAFDVSAFTYDENFTNSNIGKYLRQSVWDYLEKVLNTDRQLNILEINCGTGADAIFFASRGHQVIATDISEKMLMVAENHIKKKNLKNRIKIKKLDIRDLSNADLGIEFDLVFSNFGGLNCLNKYELAAFSEALRLLVKPGGRFIAVIMPKICLWESLYFIYKLELAKVFRRFRRTNLDVNLGGENVSTWYFNPGEFVQIFESNFRKIGLKPVGIFLPPSYTEPFFQRHIPVLNSLNRLESIVSAVPILSYLSDHFLCDMQIRTG